MEGAVSARSAWVGTAGQPTAPDTSSTPPMVLRPDGTDMSANYTTTLQNNSWAALNDPGATDANGNIVGTGDNDPTEAAPVDAYGYQEVGGNGTYNPNVAADGTDLTNAPVTAGNSINPDCCFPNRYEQGCLDEKEKIVNKVTKWTVVGEYHAGWRTSGDLSYTQGAESKIGSYIAANGEDFTFQYYDSVHNNGQVTQGEGSPAGVDNTAHRVFVLFNFWESKWKAIAPGDSGKVCYYYYQWNEHGIATPAASNNIKQGANFFGQLGSGDERSGKWWRQDGINGMYDLEDYGSLHWLQYGDCSWHTDLESGHGITYGFAADIGGVGIQAETDHTTEVDQSADARGFTCQKRSDQWTGAHDTRHWFWGYNSALVDHPKTFYMY